MYEYEYLCTFHAVVCVMRARAHCRNTIVLIAVKNLGGLFLENNNNNNNANDRLIRESKPNDIKREKKIENQYIS